MADDQIGVADSTVGAESTAASDDKDRSASWLEVLKVVAIPLVTLILGFVFNGSLNTRQMRESNIRLYTEMMGRREESDSALRKDMFNSILSTFMSKNPKLSPNEQRDLEVLNLELLASNFHESMDLAPLFKHVRRRIPDEQAPPYSEMISRLERVAHEVIEHQLTVISDSGMVERGDISLQHVNDLKGFIAFGAQTVPDPSVPPGTGVSRVCLSMDSNDGVRHYRQFKVEVIHNNPRLREEIVRLYVSKVLGPSACSRADLNQLQQREIDTTFSVGLFDFPMIDNTHLTHGERCAVSISQMTSEAAKVALAYFPGSRASLKDKPYYDDLVHDLIKERQFAAHKEP
jgi:hypothetical protein